MYQTHQKPLENMSSNKIYVLITNHCIYPSILYARLYTSIRIGTFSTLIIAYGTISNLYCDVLLKKKKSNLKTYPFPFGKAAQYCEWILFAEFKSVKRNISHCLELHGLHLCGAA